ncbi:DUF2750 domain-containing protein [Fictibacillus sp. NPDC058756]|uniref:DUF2750 domain-containing protein n=1 Tax=Fictibacillus sp. NPDC058756 TaxID=3346625 RepID=UPI0036D0132E
MSSGKSYRDFQPYEIKLEDFINKWITGLEEDGLYVGVNWSGKKATGYDVKPNELLEHITTSWKNTEVAQQSGALIE